MSKPRNWYEMDDTQRREWQKQETAREDAEYEREQSERRAEQASRDARRAEEAAKAARYDYDEMSESAQAEIDGLKESLCEARLDRDALLAAIKEPIPSALPGGTFADDLFTLAGIIEETQYKAIAEKLRDKARQMLAALAKAEGK